MPEQLIVSEGVKISQELDSKTLCELVRERVRKNRGYLSYLDACVEIMEELSLDAAFVKSLLTPDIIDQIDADARENNTVRRTKKERRRLNV